MNPTETKQNEVIVAAAALGAVIGGGLGDILGNWTTQDIQTGQQVSERIYSIYLNCPASPERAALLARLGELLAMLESPGA